MAVLGMDPQEVSNLANQFNSAAQQINTLIQNITSALNSTTWMGPDQQQFSGDWSGQHVPALKAVSNCLETERQYLLKKVQEQEQASSAGG